MILSRYIVQSFVRALVDAKEVSRIDIINVLHVDKVKNHLILLLTWVPYIAQ